MPGRIRIEINDHHAVSGGFVDVSVMLPYDIKKERKIGLDDAIDSFDPVLSGIHPGGALVQAFWKTLFENRDRQERRDLLDNQRRIIV